MVVAPCPRENAGPGSTARNPAIDGLRAVAILRVILWHTTGWPWTTWFVSSVPAMFVVTGSLIARSADRSSVSHVLRTRVSRLVGPLWFFGLVVIGLSLAANLPVGIGEAWRFFIPVLSPDSAIAHHWFTSPMWYLRAYAWVLVLSPVMLIVARRIPRTATLAAVTAVLCVAWAGLDQGPRRWMVGDILLYGTCTLVGMVFLGRHWPTGRQLFIVTIACGSASVLWCTFRWPNGSVVNNDHGLHLLIGLTWCAVLLQFPGLLARIAGSGAAKFLNSRPLSVYLWHSPVAWTIWRFLPEETGAISPVVVLLGTFLALPLVVGVVGRVELKQPHPRPFALAPNAVVLVSVAVLTVWGPARSVLNPDNEVVGLPLAPSQAPTIVPIVIDKDVQEFVTRARRRTPTFDETGDAMTRLVGRYDSAMKLGGLRVVVTKADGERWIAESGAMPPVDSRSNIGSITKTFTTTILFQLVREGKLTLAQPVGDLDVGFGHPELTVRQLLMHMSGIARYDDLTNGMDRRNGVTPRDVLRWAGSRPLEFEPGSRIVYSSTGFVVLGALIEHITGHSFEHELSSRITEPMQLGVSTFRAKFRSVGFATGGVSMSVTDLADWGREYLINRTLVDPPWKWSIKRTTGLGVHGYCPCTNGSFMALGHMGGRTMLTADGDRVVVVIDSRGVLVGKNYAQTQRLAQELRLLASGGTTPMYGSAD